MATPSSISVTEGVGKNIATHSISETTTKELQRIELNDSTGAELATAANPINVTGAVASGATDSGNPVKVGARYNTTLPTLTDGQRGDMQFGSRGSLNTTLMAVGSVNAIVSRADNADGVAASATANNLGVESRNTLYNGTTWDLARGDATNGAYVQVKSSVALPASGETSTIYNGVTALTPKFATIVASASGATTIIALVSSKKIRVLAMQLVANAAVNVKWQSHVTPTDLTGLAYLSANGGYVLPYNPVGWFQTISGEALDINLSGAQAVGGSLTYVEV